MKIIKKNTKTGEITLNLTNNEDLWHLSHIIEPEDEIYGSTERKIKIGSDENAKTTRKRVNLKIKTEKTEYYPETNSLRILGTIIQGPDDIPLGDHHSFNMEINDTITITKKYWPKYMTERLEEATKEKARTLIVAFNREEAIFASLKNNGYEILSQIKGEVQKKQDNTKNTHNFYREISAKIKEYDERMKLNHVVAASPAFWKEYLVEELPENIRKKTITTTISEVEESSLNELLKKTELKKILEDERTAKEHLAIDEILNEIRKEKACYGYKETKEKAETGAINKLFVTENLLKEMKQKKKYEEIDRLLRLAEDTKTEINIISGKEPSKKLDALGGIAGTLRW